MFPRNLILFASLLAGSVCLSACEGPAGPAGEDGIGIQGPKGDKGDKGDPGTANVIYSTWKSVATNSWTRSTVNGIVKFYHDMSAPALDQSIVDRGQVLVYVKLSQDNNQVRPLPYTLVSNLTELRLEFSFSEKNVRIWSVDPDQGRNLTPPDGQYRYVIVPGSQQGRLNYEALSYQEAVRLFGLPD